MWKKAEEVPKADADAILERWDMTAPDIRRMVVLQYILDIEALKSAMEDWDADDLAELHRMIPDLNGVLTHNPISQVAFRAGLLACREYMARFVEQGGGDVEKSIAQSIRANWWPSLGDDPGPPRQLRYDEIADEKPSGRIDHKEMSPSVEALPRAFAFIGGRNGKEAEGIQGVRPPDAQAGQGSTVGT
jgi:hypothetical protein